MEGEGVIECVFYNVPLKPGTYTVFVQIRRDLVTNYFDPRPMTHFRIVSPANAYGYMSGIAESVVRGTSPIHVPYVWRSPSLSLNGGCTF